MKTEIYAFSQFVRHIPFICEVQLICLPSNHFLIMMVAPALFALSFLFTLCFAQYPPKPEGVKALESKFDPNVKVTYKEVRRTPIIP